jgi:hypothetical protein
MLRKPSFAVSFVSLILVIYCFLVNNNSPVAYFIFSISLVLLLWMAYTIIRFGTYNGKELNSDEEWGYQDKNRDELGVL